MDKWISVNKQLPPTNSKWGESDYLLGFEYPYNMPVVCYYSSKTGNWTNAHSESTATPLKIMYWRKLPQPPPYK